jgi:tRNA dimethylallyltransferase
MLPKVIFIVGPTSSGKSAVAVSLAGKLNGEIISGDSMQIYRDMDVITQTPADGLLSRVPHYLVKTLSPEEEYNAARFAEEAKAAVSLMIGKGKTPIVAGGTGLYIKALVDGIFSSPAKDDDLRRSLRDAAKEKGKGYLYEQLKSVDPETADKLHPNDLGRVIRALEVYNNTGSTIHKKKAESEGISAKYDCRFFGLELPRKILYGRINTAIDRMFETGLVEEVKRLKARRLGLTAAKALGIKEVGAYLEGKWDIEQAKEELKKNTRRYAKRQLTWFRADRRIIWIDADRGVEEIVGDILKGLRGKG